MIARVVATLLVTLTAAAQPLTVSTIAGSTAGPGFADGRGSAARFSDPVGIAIDAAGTLYVADSANHVIRKISRDGVVTTLAGKPDVVGAVDGMGEAARFNTPYGVAVDGSGNVYVIERWNHALRKITPAGNVTTLAGKLGSAGSADGSGAGAGFFAPAGLDIDDSGNIYVADTGNAAIRKVTPGGTVTTLAGLKGAPGSLDGFGDQARFHHPWDVAADRAGNVYVADLSNHAIRRITPDGRVTTIAGQLGSEGQADGTGVDARFEFPWSVDVDDAGNVYVADTWNHTIRRITPAGVVTTVVGRADSPGRRDGQGAAARLDVPSGIIVDPSGGLFVTDRYNQAIRYINPQLVTMFFAGSVPESGEVNGTGTSARFWYPMGITTDPAGNIYVSANATIRRITPAGVVTTVAGRFGEPGSADGTGSAARFDSPIGVASDAAGNIYIADRDNHTIRKMTPAGVVTTIAGVAGQSGYADGTGAQARFHTPHGMAIDHLGNLYVADTYNHRIRIIEPTGVVATVAGSGAASGFDAVGQRASFNYPTGLAVDASRNVYVADWGNHTIRKIAPNGTVTTLAGSRGFAFQRDGNGSFAYFDRPYGIAARPDGTLFVVQENGHNVRRIDPNANVTTVSGKWETPGNTDGTGSAARFYFPKGIAVDAQGRVLIADTDNQNIRLAAVAPPSIDSFAASATVIKTPGPVTLTWSTSGGRTATLNGTGVSLSGTATVAPQTTTTYTLAVTGEGGTTTRSVTVYVGSVPRRRSVR